MFIEISNEVILSEDYSKNMCTMLRHASDAIAEGIHIVCTEKNGIAKKISEKFRNKEENIAICFQRLDDIYSTVAGIKEKLTNYIQIVSDAFYNIHKEDSNSSTSGAPNNSKILYVPVSLAAKLDFWTKTILLVEDSLDAKGYETIAHAFNKNIPIQFKAQGGGGMNISKEFKSLKNNNNIVLCIVDNDKHYPNDSIGHTAERVLAIDLPNFCHREILQMQEYENLFFWKGLCDNIPQKDRLVDNNRAHKIFDFYSSIQDEIPDIWRYFDLKKGLNYKQYKEYRFPDKYLDKISCKCNEYNNSSNNCSTCLSQNHSKCKKIVLEGIGSNFVENILNTESEKHYIQKSLNTLPESLKQEWIRLSILICTWGCCCDYNTLGLQRIS